MAKRKKGLINTENKLTDKEIDSAVSYILERRRIYDSSTWRDPADPKSHIPVSEFNNPMRVERIITNAMRHARAIHKELGKLLEDLTFNRIDSHDDDNSINELHSRLLDADQYSMRALVALLDGRHFVPKPRGTRALTEQQIAARLAVVYCERDPRQARTVAKQIMSKAGLEEPNERSLSGWITKARDELGVSNGK